MATGREYQSASGAIRDGNTAIIKGTISGSDVTDYLDTRDSILSKLSQEVGITFATRANNDMVVYTDSGSRCSSVPLAP